MTDAEILVQGAPRVTAGRRTLVWRRFRRNTPAVVGAVILVVLFVVSYALPPFLAYDHQQLDYTALLKLVQSFNIVHFLSGYPVEPADLPPATRHLDALAAALTMTDKVIHAYSLGRERIADAIELVCRARGIDRDALR